MSTQGLVELIVERLIDGRADIPRDGSVPVGLTDEEVRTEASRAATSWQLIHRVPRSDGTQLVVDALVLRTGDTRVDLVTAAPDGQGYQRVAVDAAALGEFLEGLAALR